jgi:hypothetical protein
MSRVPRHQTLSCFLLLALLFVSGTFVAGLEETTQRTLRATLLGDAVAETLLEVDRVSASGSDSAASLASSSSGQVLLSEEKKLVDEMVVVVAGRKVGGRRRLGAQKGVYAARTSGRCTNGGAGWGSLTTRAACEEGAGAVGWSDVGADTKSWSGSPRGCFLLGSYRYLRFNTDTASTTSCSSYYKCLCTLLCQPGTDRSDVLQNMYGWNVSRSGCAE